MGVLVFCYLAFSCPVELVEHMLGLALEIAKSTILAHLVQALGQVLLDLQTCMLLEHTKYPTHSSRQGTILLRTNVYQVYHFERCFQSER